MVALELDQVRHSLATFADKMCEVPTDFTINNDYLGNLSNDEFVRAFRQYRNIIYRYYKKASENMIEYGYSNINRKTGKEVLQQKFKSSLMPVYNQAQVIHFIIKLIHSSSQEFNSLVVNLDDLKQAISTNGKIHKPDKIIENLAKEGFVFDGYTKSLKKSESMIVSYPDNPCVIDVMVNYSQSIYANPEITTSGIMFDYAHFNYKLLTVSKKMKMDINSLYVFLQLNNEAKAFVTSFDKQLTENGYTYGYNAIDGLFWGDSQFAYTKDPNTKNDYVCRLFVNDDRVSLRMYLSHVNNYSKHIDKMPDVIKDSFINNHGKCRKCKGDDCKFAKAYSIGGKKYTKCNGETFWFTCLSLDTIPYYMDLIELSRTKRKRTSKEKRKVDMSERHMNLV